MRNSPKTRYVTFIELTIVLNLMVCVTVAVDSLEGDT